MDVLAEKEETRTVLRTTLIDGHNMRDPDWYAAFYQRADPDFVELKAYMHVGHSRGRLDRSNMPEHEDVVAFTEEIGEHLEHDVLKDRPPSRVALLAREEDTWVPKLRADSSFWSEEEGHEEEGHEEEGHEDDRAEVAGD
jgi:tRNA wybutosine-synthesizing protein 1